MLESMCFSSTGEKVTEGQFGCGSDKVKQRIFSRHVRNSNQMDKYR
ncbi:hypothetical protein MtrunA17_Chr2g0322511 [Medicago truncatula]|uniref:Uncharacterized protein n=1 Tax=Medicago truncatula TaxID=3880 RepID=A0A396JGW5_MEDTR|nr:hypothetical protein MtrunA17_Chr2g0322511 [Medicago truncatula]